MGRPLAVRQTLGPGSTASRADRVFDEAIDVAGTDMEGLGFAQWAVYPTSAGAGASNRLSERDARQPEMSP